MLLRCRSHLGLAFMLGALVAPGESRAQDANPFQVDEVVAPIVPTLPPAQRRTILRSAWGALAGLSIGYGLFHDDIRVVCSSALEGGACPAGRIVGETSTRPHLTAGLIGGGLALAVGWFHTRRDPDAPAAAVRNSADAPIFMPRLLDDGSLSLVRLPLGGVR